MERIERSRRDGRTVDHTTVDAARAIAAMSDTDLVRLAALARLWSRGLPDELGWTDILNEAIVRVLDGSRPWPRHVPLLAFLSGVMRSICDDHWRRARREALRRHGDVADLDPIIGDGAPDPERMLAAAQALAAINRLFAADKQALQVIAGLSEGLTAAEICRRYGFEQRDYDTTRKRMRRKLMRHGLAFIGGAR
jgi:DNA-directed RNA polymerase specialized sigma24 family protein